MDFHLSLIYGRNLTRSVLFLSLSFLVFIPFSKLTDHITKFLTRIKPVLFYVPFYSAKPNSKAVPMNLVLIFCLYNFVIKVIVPAKYLLMISYKNTVLIPIFIFL